jgi:hypothetical protein
LSEFQEERYHSSQYLVTKCEISISITFESKSRLTSSVGLKVIPEEAFSFSGLISIVIPATVRIVEKGAFYYCDSLMELVWAEGSKVQVIEEEAFEGTHLKKLVIPGSLQYIGGRICPSTTELLLTSESKLSMFEEWKASFLVNRNEVMGTRTGHEMEDGEDLKEGEDRTDGKDRKDRKDKGAKSSKCCALL